MFSRTLVAGLGRFVDRPWGELRRGKEITEQWLARQLRPYAVYPRTLWIGELSAKGYSMEGFGEVFKRYIPRSEFEALLAESRRPQETAQKPEDGGAESPGAAAA